MVISGEVWPCNFISAGKLTPARSISVAKVWRLFRLRNSRHAFATHAVEVEKIPIDIVGAWLHQKNLGVTDYYSKPTESMVAEASDLFLSRVAAQINVSEAVLRSPDELQQLYKEARGKAGTLADVIGGQCVSHG